MNVKVSQQINHDGTVYDPGSTIFNMNNKDAERLIKLNAAEEVKTGFHSEFDEEDEGDLDFSLGNQEDTSKEVGDKYPSEDKKKKSGKKDNAK